MKTVRPARVARSDGFVASILSKLDLPPLALVRQSFDRSALTDVRAALIDELGRSGALARVKPGMSIALTGGSRGIAAYPLLMRTLVDQLKRAGARPFITPAMGSHGGATAEGQRDILASLGIVEEAMGCPVRSSMETVEIGRTANGRPVFMDRLAWESDGVVLLNRVKYHTGFVGDHESGLLKMIVIGLGKQRGAESCHSESLDRMPANLLAFGRTALATGKILFGAATVENAYDRVRKISVVAAERIPEEEPALLREAKACMPALPVRAADVLVVDEIGKNISGGGMDPHVVGRMPNPSMQAGFEAQRLVVLDITEESHGSGIGLGRADFSTQRAFEKFDFEQTYPNALTSNVLVPSKIPIILADDRLAVAAALKTCLGVGPGEARVVRIKNSLDIERLYLSANLVAEALATGRVELLEAPRGLGFGPAGRLTGWERV